MKAKLVERFGLTLEQYDAMLVAQENLCAICRQPETKVNEHGNIYALAIDHDHRSDKTRGLLCHSCNLGLGKFRDDAELIRRALVYLERHKDDS